MIIKGWKKTTDKPDTQTWVNTKSLTIVNVYKASYMDADRWVMFVRKRRYESDEKGDVMSSEFLTKEEAINIATIFMKKNAVGPTKLPRDPNKMLWRTFKKNYQPIKNMITDTSLYEGYMFETVGDDVKYLNSPEFKKKYKEGNVWTIVDAEGEDQLIPGIHSFNRMGYIVTKKKWTNENLYVELE